MRLRNVFPILLLSAAGCDGEPTTPGLESSVSALFRNPARLEVGEVLTVTAAEAQTLILAGGANGAEYLYVPFNASEAATGFLNLEVRGGNVVPPTGPPNPDRAPGLAALAGIAPGTDPQPDWAFHERLREREVRELAPLVRSRTGVAANRAPAGVAAPRMAIGLPSNPGVGEVLEINANANQACSSPNLRQGRVVAVSNRAIVVEDVANPPGGFTAEEYRNIAVTFDTLIYPVDVRNFGDPVFGSFITPRERIVIFYTRVVNELTPPNSRSLIGGFFFGRDLFPREATQAFAACPASNQAPIMYLLAPDPEGAAGNVRTKAQVLRTTLATVAHEFQHLINQARRFFVFSSGQPFEEVWLNEGLSHIAEELVFYNASGLGPRQNIGVDELRAAPNAVNAFNTYQGNNIGRFAAYLEDPDTASLLGVDNLPTRGASWAFLRYAADQESGPDAPFFRSLVDGGEAGLANLRAALRVDPIGLMQTWTVSNYTDDALPGVSFGPLYQQPSWNFRGIYTTILQRYPLKVSALTVEERSFRLLGGGAAYLRFGVPAGGRAVLTTTSGGTVPGNRLRISVARIR
jgi:hypothetical protein